MGGFAGEAVETHSGEGKEERGGDVGEESKGTEEQSFLKNSNLSPLASPCSSPIPARRRLTSLIDTGSGRINTLSDLALAGYAVEAPPVLRPLASINFRGGGDGDGGGGGAFPLFGHEAGSMTDAQHERERGVSRADSPLPLASMVDGHGSGRPLRR